MKVLITGFEPLREFWSINPSWEAVRRLPDSLDGADIIKKEIPIVYDKAERVLYEAIAEHRPDAVICVGQSGWDKEICVERVGLNLDDFHTVPDNDGNVRIDMKIAENGPDAYFTTLPVRAIESAIKQAGIPVRLSEFAGTHLCNHVTYYVRHLAETQYPNMISGFIHVPLDRSQCDPVTASETQKQSCWMDIDEITQALSIAISVIAAG